VSETLDMTEMARVSAVLLMVLLPIVAAKHEDIPDVIRVIFKPVSDFHGNPKRLINLTAESDFNLGIELLHAIHDATGMVFDIKSRPDLVYMQNADGNWNGSLIGALLNNETDIVGPDLTRTAIGDKVVDFLHPFMPYKLQVIYNKKFGLTNDTQYAVADTEDRKYLQNTQEEKGKAAWASIQKGGPSVILGSTATGEEKVNSGNFAVVAESQYIRQVLQDNPGIALAPDDFGGPFYLGMAVRKGSPLRAKMNNALLQIAESGVLEKTLKKYHLWTLACVN